MKRCRSYSTVADGPVALQGRLGGDERRPTRALAIET